MRNSRNSYLFIAGDEKLCRFESALNFTPVGADTNLTKRTSILENCMSVILNHTRK